MSRKTHSRKTYRSKSYKRRHTHKRGGACPCAMRGQFGGRGAELGHAYSPSYTTGATQELYQMKGITGGSKASKKRRQERLAIANIERNAQRMVTEAERRAIITAIAKNAATEGSKRHTNLKITLLLECLYLDLREMNTNIYLAMK
jgi:hypothetical protein